MTQPLNFQEIILKLQHFWADHGCLIWQPYYTQVGAGTYNPATFLRVLGPEPWNVAYVEPSIRPDDGRYGENPNRMQQHYQFQVILKPDPGNPQELYLKSLEALGIDPRQHDIRFVEDNWESPALGAWGLGWEVWLDGQEITQFTYFQQAGGIVLDPVSVELTYGLERIAIALQRVSSFRDIQWSPTLTDGDVNLQAEQEHSRYYFEIADVERLRQMYDVYEAEARACLENGLVLPAHDYVLRCSHTFNVLDTRGAIGVTERAAFFGRMRSLSRRVAEAYLEQRQRMEFPWLKEAVENPRLQVGGSSTPMNPSHQQENLKPVTAVRRSELPQATETFNRQTEQPSTFLLEVGTEELPAGDLDSALEQLRQRVPVLFAELRLRHGLVNIQGTPRRLVVSVEAVAPVQLDLEQVFKGPPAGRAIGPDGSPTPAAEGFARSRGVAVSDLQVRELEGGRYVTAVVKQAGQPAGIVLANALPELLAGLRFDKSMRWNSSNVSFSRPVRWLLALYGDQVVPFEWARLRAGRITRGLRFQQPEVMEIENPASYFKLMREAGIWLSRIERQAVIHDQVEALASQVQGRVSPDPKLLSEIANLVESPAALRGAFDPSHLQLPRPVLTSVMKKHQRYFPVETISGNQAQAPAGTGGEGEGTLLPYFITVANKSTQGLETADDYPLVVEGNEHVIGARFADANFFVREDVKRPLEAYLPRLATLTFQVKLGSMLDKTRRVVALVEDLSSRLGLEAGETASARRAAELCKADLATNMVVEMTSLQGVMGRIYALLSGEPQAVADAIYEHYLPRFTGDAVPKDRPGLVVGLADRLDTLSGLFAAGFAPSGNKDPFAQRRAALGLVQNLIAWDLDFDLQNGLALAAGHLPVPASSQSQADCLTFIIERLRNILLELSNRYDVVDAVVTAQGNNPAGAARSAIALSEWVSRPDWHTILPAYARCVRITRDFNERFPVNPEDFTDPEERELFVAIEKAEAAPRQPGSVDDFLNAFLPMIPAINRFFDKVLVMAEDDRQRGNRLGLLQRIAALAGGVADMGKLEGF